MIDGLGPYPAYRDSGVPWLGKVPAHWETPRLKALFREVDRRTKTGTEPLLSLRMNLGLVDHAEMGGKHIPAESLIGYKRTEPGELVMNRMRAAAGLFGVTPKPGLVSPDYAVFKPTAALHLGYFGELFRTPQLTSVFRLESRGLGTGESGFLRLYSERFGIIASPRPPLDEQSAIVRFLHQADRLIRRHIRAKQKLIALLEEQRQAIIHQAVTRGLDPNVPVKASGNPWLGDVPGNWQVVRFKQRVRFQEGPGIMAADFRTNGVPLLRISCLKGDVATLEGCNFLDAEMVARRWQHFQIRAGDYLLSASASTGKVVLATHVVAGAVPYTGILRMWPGSPETEMRFVRYYIGARPFQDQIDAAKSGVAIEHFGPTHLKRMVMACPPLSEQHQIADALDARLPPS